MRILVTAGNTQAPIDRVRCVTNIFTGRTGAAIALAAHVRGHEVTLVTSRPEALAELRAKVPPENWRTLVYRTFADLDSLLENELKKANPDAVIHTAAVSDYLPSGIYAPMPGTSFSSGNLAWKGDPPTLANRSAGKVKSGEPELWLRLVRAPKLVDKLRQQWFFPGIVVKFKLEVAVSQDRLLDLAERSRARSDADLMVANTLEESHICAYLGPRGGIYDRVSRTDLPERLLAAVENKFKERTHG